MKTYYLEMFHRNDFNAKYCNDKDIEIKELIIKQWEMNKFLYEFVGSQWQWKDKLQWNDKQWMEYSDNNNIRTWICYKQASIVGYYDLKNIKNEIEIAYFGLTKYFIGQGYGGHLLSTCIENAWNWNAKRIWVHTCDYDHAAALYNYKSRGLKIYKIEDNAVQQAAGADK